MSDPICVFADGPKGNIIFYKNYVFVIEFTHLKMILFYL